ncbi:MAG: TIGR03862 family flavoprotein [Verrucomicrobiaceae bacterium]|nr:MAG: TIGR03862 family flavoprotein [Verrucomicrobiaceae bacterium]
MSTKVCVVGGGPAGLRAAEVATAAGAAVSLFDTMPSVGRKFLVAGRGGLNITNTDTGFVEKFSGPGMPSEIWRSLLSDFSPESLRTWVEEFGIKTFSASSGRIYPEKMKSAPLLRRWIARLRSQGVRFFPRHRWTGWREGGGRRRLLDFQTSSEGITIEADAVVFALGGGSWPVTGSDGTWQEKFSASGIAIHPLVPANCGWETDWPQEVLTSAEGKPLKNIRARAGDAVGDGELLITAYGLEGGAIYSLGPALRENPVVVLDFKPAFSFEALMERMPVGGTFHLHEAFERCRIQETARVLLRSRSAQWTSRETFAAGVKEFPVRLNRPRPLAEAISSAGGVCWSEIDENLMLKKFPGIFVAGEMVDWEAPTGGYLMQGCFCMGTRAGRAAADFI